MEGEGGWAGDQLSSRKYEEFLDILLDHKWTFEDHLLNIVQKVNQKIHILARISKYMPQRKLGSTMKPGRSHWGRARG